MLNRLSKRNFGLLQEYHRRAGKKLHNNYSLEDPNKFFVTSSRPGNFGEHVDMKLTVDNWFEDNRIFNEADTDVKRTQVYLLNAAFLGGVLSLSRMMAMGIIGRLNGWKAYDRDTYMEYDIGNLPPGETMQVVWNGEPVFIRRLTKEEKVEEDNLPEATLLDKSKDRDLIEDVNDYILVCSAKCTHLGCIPIPYLGAFKGWVCICHGSVYDKMGRVRQGPALDNLPLLNNSLYGSILCVEELKYPREPSERFWA
jgi:ubiquinol-cytochrome c reductase iron-sulfur subunit